MLGDLQDLRVEDGLDYPYKQPKGILTTFPDTYERNIFSLVSSLSRFGHRIQGNQASVRHEYLRNVAPTITRLCDDALWKEDFAILLEHHPPRPMKKRIILDSSTFKKNDVFQTPEATEDYEQFTIVHIVDTETIAIYLVFPTQGTIEAYFIGDHETNEVETLLRTIQGWFFIIFQFRFELRQRLQLPPTFINDPVSMAYILTCCLHERTKYLDLNLMTIAIQKLRTMTEFIRYHDEWLGQLDLDQMTEVAYPFFWGTNPTSDNIQILTLSGWTVLDVQGDGNCGYYCLILGLENNGISRYLVKSKQSRYIEMKRNKPWQFNIMKLRHELQRKSRKLVAQMFPNEDTSYPWCIQPMGLVSWDEMQNLSHEFYTDELTQVQYFDGSLAPPLLDTAPDYSVHQLSVFWGMHVFACLFRIRVIVYMRTTERGATEDEFVWQTATMDHTAEYEDRIHIEHGLNKISDVEYKQRATVEIFYTTGFGHHGPVDNHYRFLRRVLCDEIVAPNHVSVRTLRDYITPVERRTKYGLLHRPEPRKHEISKNQADKNPEPDEMDVHHPDADETEASKKHVNETDASTDHENVIWTDASIDPQNAI